MSDKIISLEVNNVKRIKAVSIAADGTMNVIAGKNGNGKSSTLDSIEMALRGAKFIPDMPVRAGQENARIVVETNEMTITRHWTNPETSYLKVETKQYGKVANAQDTLNAIVGNLSFDPLEFSTMEPKKRVAILKDISKLDFTELDKEYKEKFEERTVTKKEADTYATTAKSFQAHELTKPEFDIKDIQFKREEAQKHNKAIETIREQKIPSYEKVISTNKNKIESLKKEVEAITKSITEYEKSVSEDEKSLEELREELKNSTPIETTQFDEMIQTHANYDANLKLAKQRQEVIEKRDAAQIKVSTLTARLDEILSEKRKQLSEAKMPIQGLSFADNDILFNDMPFMQLSTSEQIQVSMSIAMALNPRLKIIIIKNGSLLDSDAMKKIHDLAEANDFQIWLEKVADTPDGNSIFIEDGEIYGQKNADARGEDQESEPNDDAFYGHDLDMGARS